MKQLKNNARKLKNIARKFKFLLEWSRLNQSTARRWAPANPMAKVVIQPPDPWSLTGSRGDEAMIYAVIGTFKDALPQGVRIGIVVGSERAEKIVKAMGVEPLRIWEKFLPTTRALLDYQPDAVVIIGADCMDGHYNPETSSRFVATADILARRGVPVAFTGFSFNEHPHPLALQAFKRLSPKARVNLRDPISFERFRTSTRQPADLVADVAFQLRPALASEAAMAVKQWVEQQRADSRKVLAFNVHPHLVKDANPVARQRLVAAASAALARIMSETDLRFVLLAHDFRERDGDRICLAPIHEALKAQGWGERVLYPTAPFSASELKGLAGTMDGVITGRMHLAIASLGMGVPIAVIAYQGKFSGLLKHFEYPEEMLINADDAREADSIYALLKRFDLSLDTLRELTAQRLPAVKQLSFDTLKPLLPGS